MLLRGVEAVLAPVYEHLHFGPLKILLGLGNWDEVQVDEETIADKHLASIKHIWADDKYVEVYDTCLSLLRKTWAWMAQFQDAAVNYSPD